MNTKTTAQLIAEYDERIAARFVNANLGSARYLARQAKIDAIVDELSARADAGDEVAENWYDES